MPARVLAAAATLSLIASACDAPPADGARAGVDALAEEYVQLVLAVGVHDPDFVDAYYGPEGWREAVAADVAPLEDLAARAARLAGVIAERAAEADGPGAARLRMLGGQMRAVEARVAMLGGARLSFDEESRLLYDAVAPPVDPGEIDAALAALDAALGGTGALAGRYERWLDGFVIPPDRLDAVFRAAIEECRERTAAHVTLPQGESFVLEYVTDKPWSGYNWYQGDFRSLIQVNEELPIQIDRAVDLACHEGYPGHHAFNVLIERRLVRDGGQIEFSVYPLFSPLSLIAEGTANLGIEIAFPGDERLAFERDTLFPLAGLDPGRAAEYRRVRELAARVAYEGHETARQYLDGLIDADGARRRLVERAMMTPERAAQRVSFFDRYRSYVINYTLGRDIVRAWVDADAGSGDAAARWARFSRLLEGPRLPSELRAELPPGS